MSLQIVITTEAHRGYFVFSLYQPAGRYNDFVFSLYQFRFLHFSSLSRYSNIVSCYINFVFSFFNFVFSLYQLCFLVISNLSFFLFSCYINLVFLLYHLCFFSIFSPFSQLRFLVIST